MHISNFNALRKYGDNSSSYTTETNSLEYMFYKCTHITNIDESIFENYNIENIDYMFANSTVANIYPNTFNSLVNLESMEYAFKNCTSLTSIPSGIFEKNANVTNIEGLFQGCTSLASIPSNIFSKMTGLTSVDNVFKNCPIPSGTTIDFSNVPNIASAVDFLGVPANYTIIVPGNTTTETTFTQLGYNILVGDSFKITVDTTKLSESNTISAIPFNLYGQTGITLTVNWGDGNTSTLTPSDYASNNSTASNHTYASAGTYHIIVKSSDWPNTYMRAISIDINSASYNVSSNMYYYKKTLVSIDGVLPNIKGMKYTTSISATSMTTSNNSLIYCFMYCCNLTYENIPENLFILNTNVTNFQYCFYGCTSLTTIPADLFRYNTAVTTFSYCFYYCTSLMVLPQDLFKYNTAVTSFGSCFYNCSSLTTIPANLFRYNTHIQIISYCFQNCSSLENFKLAIGSSVLHTLTNIITKKDGTIRKICAPLNSSTYTNLSSYTSTYGYIVGPLDECAEYIEYTINTQATTSGAKIGTIPLRNLSNNKPLIVDWGDNNANTLYANDFTGYGYTHEYTTAGTYTITVQYDYPEYIEFLSVMGNNTVSDTDSVRLFRETLVDNKLCISKFDSIRKFNNNSSTSITQSNSLAYMYYNASNITSIDNTYLTENYDITDISYTFAYSSVTSINTNTFKYFKNLTTVDGAFKGCTIPSGTIINFFNSPNISSATDFLDTPANYTIIVPVDSVTETTFTNLGYNIIQGDVFKFTVDTTKISATNKISGIPFTLYNQTSGTTLTVNWGDGNTSTLTSSNYSSSSTTASNHTYSTAGTYTISIKCNNWDGLRLMCVNSTTAPSSSYNRTSNMYYFKKTLISLDSPIPHLLGAYVLSSYSSSSWSSYANPFGYCTFAYCEALTTIHPYFFLHYNNDNITTLAYCFYKCSSLTSIPTGLFDNITSITSFQNCFSDCSSLTSIPTDLFKYNTAVITFSYCFQNCTALTSIPSGLFYNNTAVTNFQYCFYQCSSITSIPAGLFDNNTSATSFSSCFRGCSSLTSIPSGLFDNCTDVTSFSYCFSYCTSLTIIPQDLFRYNTAETNFSYCFNNCSSLSSIPTDLFRYNTAATNFSYCFSYCTSLTIIPQDLFKYNTVVTTFSYCFRNCTSLTTIPEDLFRYNTAITSFAYCFYNCSSLTTIPIDLFRYNTAVTTFSYCFNNCSSLNDFTIHIGSTLVSIVTSFVTKKTGTTRTVYVPAGSTTKTNFDSAASSLGLTIIAE